MPGRGNDSLTASLRLEEPDRAEDSPLAQIVSSHLRSRGRSQPFQMPRLDSLWDAAYFGLDRINCLLAMYLMLGPCGARYSLDAWRRRRRPSSERDEGSEVKVQGKQDKKHQAEDRSLVERGKEGKGESDAIVEPSVAANIQPRRVGTM